MAPMFFITPDGDYILANAGPTINPVSSAGCSPSDNGWVCSGGAQPPGGSPAFNSSGSSIRIAPPTSGGSNFTPGSSGTNSPGAMQAPAFRQAPAYSGGGGRVISPAQLPNQPSAPIGYPGSYPGYPSQNQPPLMPPGQYNYGNPYGNPNQDPYGNPYNQRIDPNALASLMQWLSGMFD